MYYTDYYITAISNDKEMEETVKILWLPATAHAVSGPAPSASPGHHLAGTTPTLLKEHWILTGSPVICMHTEV